MKYVWVDIKVNYFMKIKILIPVYNDWKSAFKLLDEIKIEFLCFILNNRKEYQLKIDTKNLINLINLPLIQIINQAEVINIENLMPKLDKIKHNI